MVQQYQRSQVLNAQDESQYYLSDLPPDEQQQVDAVSTQQLASDAEQDFYLSDLPTDEQQPVNIASAQALNTPSDDNSQTSSKNRTGNDAPPSAGEFSIRSLKDINYADALDSAPVAEGAIEEVSPQIPLDYQEMYHIIREVALLDSGDAVFGAISQNEEYTTPNQPAYEKRQFGLGFGFLRFTQASTHLGSLLQIMQRREPQLFAEVFAPHAEELLQALTAPTEAERLQLVGGEVLWSDNWVAKFKQAATIPAFQAAQNEEAIEHLFKPMLPIAYHLGFVTDRSLAMVFDRVVTQGLGTGIRWVIDAINILPANSHRMAALELLNHTNLASFQATVDWIPQGEQFGPHTYAALVGALRSEQVIPLSTTGDLQQRLVGKALGSAKLRLDSLASSQGFEDIAYSLT